jgi:hypothetical protein
MRTYELWKFANSDGEPRRLEDAAGPVLFERECDAEEYFHMGKVPATVADTGHQIREVAAELRTYRKRPCLLFISRQIVHGDVIALRAVVGDVLAEGLDVVVSSPGGNLEAAYLVARELRRRVTHLTVFVPFQTKSIRKRRARWGCRSALPTVRRPPCWIGWLSP